jgi:predicted esterase
MAEVIPDVVDHFDVDDLLRLAAPRPMLVVSASDDPYSHDASEMVRLAQPAHLTLEHAQFEGGHAVTRERFDRIVDWIAHAGRNQARIL